MKWRSHIISSEFSLARQLAQRINGLTKIASCTSFRTRLMVANGIFQSKLCYCIQVWGGAEGYLLNALQRLQNKAARAVTRKCWSTATRTLLKECKWLSVRQLVFYHTVLSVHKIVTSGQPTELNKNFSTAYHYSTRQATSGGVRTSGTSRTKRSQSSFTYRGASEYNGIPASIRQLKNIETFKLRLKQWTEQNIPIS